MTVYLREKNEPKIKYSLVALRAFREAARRESFTIAAMRLSVTQSAVSHHIKLLEEQLDVKLFFRRGRRLSLTDEGQVLFQSVDEVFNDLDFAVENIKKSDRRQRLVLGVLSSFATKWLVPRLGGFYRAHPNVELVVRSVNHTIDVERENVDMAVINLPLPPRSPKVNSILMWRECLFAVCSPGYLKNAGPLRSVSDLSHHVLLHDETEIAAERGFDWFSWLNHFNKAHIMDEASSQFFSQSDLVLQAAIAGHGVALTRTSIASTDIRAGLLLKPFLTNDMPTQSACYLCGLKGLWNLDKSTLLREWLLSEVSEDKLPAHSPMEAQSISVLSKV